jgi:hypothetical protein
MRATGRQLTRPFFVAHVDFLQTCQSLPLSPFPWPITDRVRQGAEESGVAVVTNRVWSFFAHGRRKGRVKWCGSPVLLLGGVSFFLFHIHYYSISRRLLQILISFSSFSLSFSIATLCCCWWWSTPIVPQAHHWPCASEMPHSALCSSSLLLHSNCLKWQERCYRDDTWKGGRTRQLYRCP